MNGRHIVGLFRYLVRTRHKRRRRRRLKSIDSATTARALVGHHCSGPIARQLSETTILNYLRGSHPVYVRNQFDALLTGVVTDHHFWCSVLFVFFVNVSNLHSVLNRFGTYETDSTDASIIDNKYLRNLQHVQN